MRRIIGAIAKAVEVITSVTGQISSWLLVAVAIFVFINTVTRFAGHSLPWLFSLTCYGVVICAFLGASYGLREGAHVRVELFTTHISERARCFLDIFIYIIALVFFVILGWKGAVWVQDAYVSGLRSTTALLSIPLWIIILVIPVGCFLLCLQSIRIVIDNISHLPKALPRNSSSRLIDRPLVDLSLVIVALIAGAMLLIYVHPLAGLLIILLTLLFAGMPVAFALGVVGCLGIYCLFGSSQFIQLPLTTFKQLNSFPLTAAPLFILGGMLMSDAGLADGIFSFVETWIRRVPSPLLIVTVLSGGIFCAVTGSSVAATAAISAIALPLLFARGYDKRHSCGVVAGSTVGTLIPPSNGFILYGIIVSESISRLFMAGVLPAVFLFSLYIVFILLRSFIRKEHLRPPVQQISAKEKVAALKSGAWGIIAPVIILGGIYLGWFTPTEAGGILVVYALIVGVFILKTLTWQKLRKSIKGSTQLSLMVLCIVAFAAIYGSVVSQHQIMHDLMAAVEMIKLTPAIFLFILFFILLVLGMFLECVSIMMITLPITFPIAMALGINPLWFGVFYILNGEIALLTPPVGLNLFVIKGVSGMSLNDIVRGTIPFLIIMVLTLITIYFIPQLCTWLPSTMH